jgi:dTDP-4-amino-4,6-dideoxygalactose transaminase
MADIAAWIPLKPHYCEVSPTDLSMTPETVSACINDRTAIILATHPIVNCCDAEGLEELGLQYGIPVIFDSVESVFETLQNRRIGSFGAAECFSLHACKLLNGFGGGYLTTNDGDLARKLSSVRTFGFLSNDHIGISGGLNAKLNEMHAALALASLDDLDIQIQLNRERYYLYKHLLRKNRCVKLVEFDEENQSGYKNIVIKLTEKWPLPRDVTIKVLNAENILARAHYSPPLHRKSHHIPHKAGDMCKTDSLSEYFLNLPCGQRVNNDDIFEIVALIEFLKQNAKKILQTVRVG